jgi:hypothetical protein
MSTQKIKSMPLDYLKQPESIYLVKFFERYNYNSQIIEDFTEINDYKGIYKFNFVRCSPNTSVISQNVCLVIDLDKIIFPIRIPIILWQYVFESSTGAFKVKKNCMVKLILTSSKQKLYFKAPISILLLLGQIHFDLNHLNEESIRKIGLFWESFLPLIFESKSLVSNNKYEDYAPYRLEMNLLIEKKVINDLFSIIINRPHDILMQYIEEFAQLEHKDINQKENPDSDENRGNEKEEKKGENVKPQLKWNHHYIRDKEIEDLYYEWREKSDLKRNALISDHFKYYNIEFDKITKDDFKYWNYTGTKFAETPVVPFIDTNFNFKSIYLNFKDINIRCIEVDSPRLNQKFPIFDFIEFYKTEFNKKIELINYNYGLFLFREKSEENSINIETTDIIVKSDVLEYLCQEFGAGSHSLRDLIGEDYANKFKFFVFNPGRYIYQYNSEIIINVFQEWLDENKQPLFEFLQKFIILRNVYHLQLDLVLFDALSNTFFSTFFWQSGVSDKNLINSWAASEKKENSQNYNYTPNFTSEDELQKGIEKEVEKKTKNRDHPIISLLKIISGEKSMEDFGDFEEEEENYEEWDEDEIDDED